MLQANIDNLEAAMGRGLRRAKINGEEVEYNGPAEMRQALAYFRSELSRIATGAVRGGLAVSYTTTGRGF
ncbi:hypothetical protein GCM10023209_19510 [Roseibacterium beibuensis]|uniref:GpW protein n=2 Tax=[Roseibacterium] beibuensis TaxID=1193142 RepID=A0ABP9LB34_9RHOB